MQYKWRRDRDSNPGDGFPPTHFPGVRLRPLGHLSNVSSILRIFINLARLPKRVYSFGLFFPLLK